ncbi:phosphorylase superfamily protein [Colletotrichum sojae]|uniref:Phosphorylase superfamily protein n=1 Tax=Colletotrichum sojae TaxID=2175907 RepID=A0A8H6JBX1_9PEZI|nr:phosphorylase superfamily protein [Colletotrichum sojae]
MFTVPLSIEPQLELQVVRSLNAAIVTISFIENTTRAYRVIGGIRDLPKVFAVVQKDLPLVGEMMQSIKGKLPQEEDPEIRKTIMLCQQHALSLWQVFQKLEFWFGQDRDVKEWDMFEVYYVKSLDGLTTLRVEYMMGLVLEYLNKLAAMEIFGLAARVDRIAETIEELKNVAPSVEESELKTSGR